MSKLGLNPNQFKQTAILAGVVIQPSVNTQSCQINPNYGGSISITAGTAVKLSNIAAAQIVVEPTSSPTDGPVFGVIAYNMRINILNPGDYCEVAGKLDVIYMESSAAVVRGSRVSVTNATNTTNDPTIASDVTSGHYTVGFAEGSATGAAQLVRVMIDPGLNIVPSSTSTCVSVTSP